MQNQLSTTNGTIRPENFQSSGYMILGNILDDFLACPCSSSIQSCVDLAEISDISDLGVDHSLSLREENMLNRKY